MTGGTFLFKRTGAVFFVAAGTLLMKGISSFGSFFITFIGIMAFSAGLGVHIIIFFLKLMMAVSAGKTVAEFGCVSFVIK
jgi:hypothetical protein